jgi:hypothetical protein
MKNEKKVSELLAEYESQDKKASPNDWNVAYCCEFMNDDTLRCFAEMDTCDCCCDSASGICY